MSDVWFQTYTGRVWRPLDPQPEDVVQEDIAHALALTNRFNGATREPYSVAQHCCLVADSLGYLERLGRWTSHRVGEEFYG